MKLYATLSTPDGTREAKKATNGELHVKLYLGNTMMYHLKMNEHGHLIAYALHDTDERGVYTRSVLCNEYLAMQMKAEKRKRKRNA